MNLISRCNMHICLIGSKTNLSSLLPTAFLLCLFLLRTPNIEASPSAKYRSLQHSREITFLPVSSLLTAHHFISSQTHLFCIHATRSSPLSLISSFYLSALWGASAVLCLTMICIMCLSIISESIFPLVCEKGLNISVHCYLQLEGPLSNGSFFVCYGGLCLVSGLMTVAYNSAANLACFFKVNPGGLKYLNF